MKITITDFRMPCVYEFLHSGTTLYVGFSSVGFSGVFKKHQRSRDKAFNQADEIHITVFSDVAEARAEQDRLIELLRPQGLSEQVQQSTLDRLIEQEKWIQQGRLSFEPGVATLQQFLADIPKRTALWYRMKAAFEEGRRLAIQDNDTTVTQPKYY